MQVTKVRIKETGEVRKIKLSRYNPEIHEPLDFIEGKIEKAPEPPPETTEVQETETPVEEPKKKRSWKKKIIS